MNTVFSFMIILFAFRKKRYWFEWYINKLNMKEFI
jgi:hypothetical protein